MADSERSSIVNHFLKSSPSGEFANVVADLRILMGEEDLLSLDTESSFRDFNTSELTAVDVSGKKSLVTKFNELDSNHYLDPCSGQVFTFDHFSQTVTEVRAIEDSEVRPCEEQRAAVESSLASYAAEHFPEGVLCVFATGDSELTVCVSAMKTKLDSFWSGRWRSVWTVTLDEGSATLKGNLRANVHYFENGNVQLTTKWSADAQVSFQSVTELGQAVKAAIMKHEIQYHVNLEEAYTNLPSAQFKDLRRQLPVTRQPINWAALGNYRLGSDISGKK